MVDIMDSIQKILSERGRNGRLLEQKVGVRDQQRGCFGESIIA